MARRQAGLSESQIAEKFLYDDEEEVLEPSDGKHLLSFLYQVLRSSDNPVILAKKYLTY
jgi:hypothetical protein